MRSDRSLTSAHTHTHLDKLGNSGWHRRNILPSIFVHCTHTMPWVNTHTNSPSLSPPPSLSLSLSLSAVLLPLLYIWFCSRFWGVLQAREGGAKRRSLSFPPPPPPVAAAASRVLGFVGVGLNETRISSSLERAQRPDEISNFIPF